MTAARNTSPHVIGIIVLCSVSLSTNKFRYANAFTAPQLPNNKIRAPWSSTTSIANNLFSSENDNSDDKKEEFDGFNPFQPGAKMPTKGGFGILSDEERKPTPSTPGGQISPRQMRMKELTTDLLACLTDDESVAQLLQKNEDFLMDQLNNLDAVLEVDSVYTPDMSREERFGRYREVMNERIETARAPAVKKACLALYDFVTARE